MHRHELPLETSALSQDLITYLDARFRETSQQIAATQQQIASLREETAQRFEQIDQRFEQVDHRFEQVNQRFEQVNQRLEAVDQRFEQVDQRFEAAETTARHTLILVEGLRHEIHTVAEGFLGLNEKLERYRQESQLSFSQVQGWIEPYFRNLDGRIKILEGWADRQNWDVVKSVRRILGRPVSEQQAG